MPESGEDEGDEGLLNSSQVGVENLYKNNLCKLILLLRTSRMKLVP